MGLLAGKTVFVTGGSRGLGRAIALASAAAGARVAITYRERKAEAASVREELEELGAPAAAIEMEVTDRRSVTAAADEAERRLGRLSVLVNNAGINRPADFDRVTDEDWDAVLAVNLKGPFIASQEMLPRLARGGGGAIVHVGSVSGQYGGPRTAHYAAAKAGLISLSQVIARFGAKDGVRSNVVAAGLIASEMASAGLASPAVAKAAEGILMRRLGTPQEVADAVVFLASDRASYVTAQVLNVNGGLYF